MTGAHIVSTFSGMPYTDFVKERIFDPIGMWDTTYSPAEATRSGKLTQAWTAEGRRIPFWFPDSAMELNAGPGGVISNVVDLVAWIFAGIALRLTWFRRRNGSGCCCTPA